MRNVGKRGKVSLLGRLTTAKQRGTATTLRAHEVGRVLDALRPAAPQPDHGVGELRAVIKLAIDRHVRPSNYLDERGRTQMGLGMIGVNEATDAILAALKASEKGNG